MSVLIHFSVTALVSIHLLYITSIDSHLSVCLSFCVFVCLFWHYVSLSVNSMFLSVSLSSCPSACGFDCLYVFFMDVYPYARLFSLSVYLSVFLPICLYTCLSVCLSVRICLLSTFRDNYLLLSICFRIVKASRRLLFEQKIIKVAGAQLS